ncbi:MAG TPA: hypothetical protein VHE61_07715 [Opitutaceae bacterium]|nr:hypothetical protein [Opitutaceae bacterium]
MFRLRFKNRNGSTSHFARVVSVLAVLLIGLLAFLAASPAAHERLHPDAGHESHECVVTTFAAGEALYVAPQIVVQPTPTVVGRVEVAVKTVVLETAHDLLPPACGPPARRLNT